MNPTPFAPPPRLPSGTTARPLDLDDAQVFTDLVRAGEAALVGEPLLEITDVLGEWRQPSLDVPLRSLGIFKGDDLVAGQYLRPNDTALAVVHPDRTGEGLGTALVSWASTVVRRDGGSSLGQTVPAGSAAEDFLTASGWAPTYDAWLLRLAAEDRIEASPPTGIHIEQARDDADLRAAHRVVEDAFGEWEGRRPVSYEDWRAEFVGHADFEPWQIRVAREHGDPRDDGVVGVAVVAAAAGDVTFVHELAVRADRRGRGLGAALLADAFGEGRSRGLAVGELSTDSRTGALDLYLRLGMRVTSTWRHLEVALG